VEKNKVQTHIITKSSPPITKCHHEGSRGITAVADVESANAEKSNAMKLNRTVLNARDWEKIVHTRPLVKE